MLDFYLIAPEQSKPASPEQAGLLPAGSMDDATFRRLKTKRLIGGRFEYDADFRWSREVIAQMLITIAQRRLQADTDVKQLLSILDHAYQSNSSLIAYAD